MNLSKFKLPEAISFVNRDSVLGNGLKLAGGLILIVQLAVLIVFNRVPPQVPFFYTRPWGEAQIADKRVLLIFALASLLIGLIGLFFSIKLYKLDQVLSRLLIWCLVVGLFLALLSVITVWLRVGY